MYKKILISLIFTLSIFSFTKIEASNISSTYHFAYGENIGFIDFSGVTVGDTTLSGSIYSPNVGFIDLSTVSNNKGTLSGYAYGENIGWVDFSNVTIDSNGIFQGYAYSPNVGFITFGTDTNKVVTDWRIPTSHTSSGSSAISRYNNLIAMGNTKDAEIVKKEYLNNTQTTTTTITKTLKLKSKGDDVKALQSYLNTKLNLTLITDGYFGNLTKQALIKFQKANNLKPDGILGPITRALLK